MTDFTFSAATGNPGGDSPWYDISQITDAFSYLVTGTFNATISLRYSNNDGTPGSRQTTKGTDYVTDPQTHTAPDGPREIPPGVAKYIQFAATAYVSGSPKVSLAKARTTEDNLKQDISPQSDRTTGPSTS